MSKYTAIIQELKQINDAKFQLICDQFLSTEYKGDLTSPGTVIGKEKTKKGKPDSFLRTSDGNYILGEYTTKSKSSKTAFLKKLEKDLKDCFELQKFNITKEQVNLILLCCNSKLEISEIEYLTTIAKLSGYELRLIGIDTLAMFLYSKGKIAARDLLGIPFDTGQILSKPEFLKQYHKRNISTPLDNILFGREKLLPEIIDSISKNNITILKGAAGVGKSRLALKAIDDFIVDNRSHIPYYIVQKNNSITEDLNIYLETDNNYILFIDDANRQIYNMLSALDLQVEKLNNRIKIVMTVRDYAKDDILEKCNMFHPFLINIDKLTDEIIRQILKSDDFNLQDEKLIDRIVEVSKGNPRLAIMSVKVVLKNPDIRLLQDVSVIYNEYFDSYINDKELFKDKNILKVLGLLSFFYAMDMRSEIELKPLHTFNIPQDKFIEIVHTLEDLEIVDIYMKDTVKISEQVLATYFFYKVFIAEKLLSFEFLLNEYFLKYPYRMKDSIYPSDSAFGKENVIEKVSKELSDYWNKIKYDDKQAIVYLDIFGKYFANQVFFFVTTQIEKVQIPEIEDIQYDFLNKGHGHYSQISRVLESFFYSTDKYELLTSIELAIDYSRKFKYTYEGIVKSLQNSLKITNNDILNDLFRQQLVFERLHQLTITSKIHCHVFYHIHTNTILNSHFPSVPYHKNLYGKWELITPLQNLRRLLWENIIETYDKLPDIITSVLISYLDKIQNSNTILLEFDYLHMTLLIEQKLSPELFSDCIFVQRYLEAINKRGLFPARKDLQLKFSNRCYQTCMILCQSRFRGKDVYQIFNDYDKIEAYKISEIKKDILVVNLNDFKIVYGYVTEIMRYPHASKFNLIPMMEQFLSGILEEDLSLGFKTLNFYLSNGNIVNICPVSIYKCIFKSGKIWIKKIYSLITSIEFSCKEIWLERYFDFLPAEMANSEVVQQLLDFYNTRRGKPELYTGRFDNYLAVDSNIYYKLFKASIIRYAENKEFKYEIGYQFFQKNKEFVNQHISLCKSVYLQQFEIHNSYDHDCLEFLMIFEKDNNFIFEFIDKLISLARSSFSRYHKDLSILWSQNDGENVIYNCLIKFITIEYIPVSDHIGTMFFMNLKNEYVENAIELLKRFSLEFINNVDAINLVLDITRNCFKPFYLELIRYIVSGNKDIEFFRQLQWYNNHFSSNGEIIWSDFKADELRKIHKVIKDLPDAKNYILHLDNLETNIGYEEAHSYREKKMRFMGLR